jgi:hypothetical protein
MRAFARMGDRAQAIREFERCRQALLTVLDLPPSKETTAAYEAIRIESPPAGAPMIQERGFGVGSRETTIAGTPASFPASWKIERQGDEIAAPLYGVSHESRREPSIAVLPFRNLTGDPTHDFVAEGLAEDLNEALSRVPNFFVIFLLLMLDLRYQDALAKSVTCWVSVRSLGVWGPGDRLRSTIEPTDTQGAAPLISKSRTILSSRPRPLVRDDRLRQVASTCTGRRMEFA